MDLKKVAVSFTAGALAGAATTGVLRKLGVREPFAKAAGAAAGSLATTYVASQV